jgi:hypothetical protein
MVPGLVGGAGQIAPAVPGSILLAIPALLAAFALLTGR